VPHRSPIELRNLTRVRKAISAYAKQERPLTEDLVLGLHRMLMKDVPEVPGEPLKPGRFRGPTDDGRFVGFKYLSKHRPPSWRVRPDLLELLEDTESGRLGPNWEVAAGRFLYRFVRIHPFCDGNGRMARALSTLLLARDHPEVLLFEKPLDEVILEHRDDYIGVLEYCDGIYEDLRSEDIPEEEKLRRAERPFLDFYAGAFLKACRENNHKPPKGRKKKG
jgi:Fic family protein